MIDNKTKTLVTSVRKLIRRKAWSNLQGILDKAHEADIAALMEGLDEAERIVLLGQELSLEKKAEIVSYLNKELQEEALLSLNKKEVTKIMSHIDKDDAADILSYLPEEFSQEILDSMKGKEKEEVADLMQYDEDTAGGIMSSEMLALNQNLTVGEAIKELQDNDDENLISFYVYVVNDGGHLIGVLSLKHLLLAKPKQTLKQVMFTEVISAKVDMDQQEVSKLVEHYDFLSIPVVDDQNNLVGVITVDDVIDVIREEAQEDLLAMGLASSGDTSIMGRLKARLPWLVVAFLGGGICYFFIKSISYLGNVGLWGVLSAFFPIILVMSLTSGIQTSTFSVNILEQTGSEFKNFFRHMLQELAIASVFAIIFGLLMVLMSYYNLNANNISLFLGFALAGQLFFTSFISTGIPVLLKKIGLDPTLITISLFTTISNITCVWVTYGLSLSLIQ